jgi:tripartite-type tricarboxylate transporter receptor subunit TctC
MSWSLTRRRVLGGALPAALVAATPAWGQGAWPAPGLRLVVPFAPGGTTDLVARLVANGLQERLGVPVLVENRAGAGATTGSRIVAQSAPDGLTLVMSNIASHAISPNLYGRNTGYDPVRDFTHIALITQNPSVFVANRRFEVDGLQGMIAEARRRPTGLDMATSGSGSSNHLLLVQFAGLTGITLNHIPYRGAGPAMTDVIAGTVPLMSDSLPSAAGHIRQGSVRALGISGEARHPSFPDVPTFREQGVDLVSVSWFGLSGPAGLPAAVVERLNREVRAVLATPEARARYAEFGGDAGNLDPAGYAAMVAAEFTRWGPVVRASGATVD